MSEPKGERTHKQPAPSETRGSQEATIEFLGSEFGEPALYGLLPRHPIRQELMMSNDDVIAEFKEGTYLVSRDGSFGPLTIGGR